VSDLSDTEVRVVVRTFAEGVMRAMSEFTNGVAQDVHECFHSLPRDPRVRVDLYYTDFGRAR
jgi:hypothetical protein